MSDIFVIRDIIVTVQKDGEGVIATFLDPKRKMQSGLRMVGLSEREQEQACFNHVDKWLQQQGTR